MSEGSFRLHPPPIDESRSGPARSAVNQAKTHLEQEAELAIMHAKKNVLVTPTCGADMHRKGSDHKEQGGAAAGHHGRWFVCAVRVPVHFNQAARRLADPGSRIWDPGSGKAGRGASGTWEGGTKGRTFDTIATIHPQQPPKEAYSSPTRIPKCPRPSVRAWGGVALGNPWEKNANHRQRA